MDFPNIGDSNARPLSRTDTLVVPTTSWWDRLGMPHREEAEAPSQRVANKLSPIARDIRNSFPRQSRKPGGSRREGQRSGSRRIPPANCPVDPVLVEHVLRLRWRGSRGFTSVWRIRSLAAIGVAMALPKFMESPSGGMARARISTEKFCGMRTRDVACLELSHHAQRWVSEWLRLRAVALGLRADSEPWLSFTRSRGMPRQVGWAVTTAFHRAGVPAWSLSQLLKGEWMVASLRRHLA